MSLEDFVKRGQAAQRAVDELTPARPLDHVTSPQWLHTSVGNSLHAFSPSPLYQVMWVSACGIERPRERLFDTLSHLPKCRHCTGQRS